MKSGGLTLICIPIVVFVIIAIYYLFNSRSRFSITNGNHPKQLEHYYETEDEITIANDT